jgi:GNAT superfamily N-acetyltransferase
VIAIRQAGIQDAEIVSSMVTALLRELSGKDERPAIKPELAAELLAMRSRVFGLLAFDDDRPIGVIMVTEAMALFASGIYGIITELYVVPEFRSSGVAKLLIGAAAELGKRQGWKRLEVGAPRQPTWSRSLAFYLNFGFTEIGPRLRLSLT